MNTQMKDYWNNLNERDRWALALGIISTLFYLFYLLVYSPLTNALANTSQQLIEKQETLLWMQQIKTSNKSKQAPEVLTSSKLLTVLATQLNQNSLKQFPAQLHQTATSDIQLTFEQVPYNVFIAWLLSINEKYSIIIKQLNVEHTDLSGIVKVTLIIASK